MLSYYEKVMFGYNFLNVVGNVGYACRLTVNFCQGVNLFTREGPNVSTRRQRLSSARTQNPINIYYFVTRNISWRYRSCLDILTTCWNRLGNRLQWKRSRNSQNGASPLKKRKKKTPPLFAPPPPTGIVDFLPGKLTGFFFVLLIERQQINWCQCYIPWIFFFFIFFFFYNSWKVRVMEYKMGTQ